MAKIIGLKKFIHKVWVLLKSGLTRKQELIIYFDKVAMQVE